MHAPIPRPLPDASFWKNKRVFLTGHTGFIGGWLTLWLHDLGAKVHGFSLVPESKPNFFTLCNLDRLCDSEINDIRARETLEKSLKKFKPDIVLHLAAQALVRPAFKNPVDTLSTNVMGTAHMLEAMRHTPSVKAGVIFTTDKVYENTEVNRGYLENDRLGGYEPYGVSKACAEMITGSYWHSYFKGKLGLATIRAGNVIGGGDWAEDRLIPDAVRAFTKGKPLEIRHPEAIRPWQHVLEPCYAILLLCEKMAKDTQHLRHYNIGPDESEAKNVGWIADNMVERWKGKAAWNHAKSDSIYEAKLLTLNNSLAKKELNWHPVWSTAKTMDYTVDWYKAWDGGDEMDDFSRAQLERFLKDIQHV